MKFPCVECQGKVRAFSNFRFEIKCLVVKRPLLKMKYFTITSAHFNQLSICDFGCFELKQQSVIIELPLTLRKNFKSQFTNCSSCISVSALCKRTLKYFGNASAFIFDVAITFCFAKSLCLEKKELLLQIFLLLLLEVVSAGCGLN